MAEYRDEKETLRRRVVELEARLEELSDDDSEGTIAALRAERDGLRRERDALSRERDGLERALERVRARRGLDGSSLRRRGLRALVVVGALGLAVGLLAVIFGAPVWVGVSAFGTFVGCVVAGLFAVSPLRAGSEPTETPAERVERARREVAREKRKKRQALRARVEVERDNATVQAKRRRSRKRRR